MKKLRMFCLLMAITVLLQGVISPVGATVTDSGTHQTGGSFSLDGSVPLLSKNELVENVSGALLYEISTQTLMYGYNVDERIYPASFVKIMTALLAIEKGRITDAVTVDSQVINAIPKDAVSCDLKKGEVIPLEDLLYCMMVGSANDAAVAIAVHVSGSQQAFVAEMNAYAKELGCTGSNFTNVHGLHDDNQYSTVRDTAKILNKALESDVFRSVFCAATYKVPATNLSPVRNLTTGNFLMNDDIMAYYYDTRVIGGRTGVTEDGCRSIATLAKYDGMELICVITGSTSVLSSDGSKVKEYGGYAETSKLLDIGFSGYDLKQIVFKNQIMSQHTVLNGNCDVIVAADEDIYGVLPDNIIEAELQYRYTPVSETISAPVEKGQKISSVEIWYMNVCIAQADLFAVNKVSVQISEEEETVVNEDDPISVWWIVLAVVAVLVIGFLIFRRTIRRKAAGRRGRRYRRSRRRSY